ncbi:MAG: SDR family NAD(P)-dependent oxidoreductase [Dehalococcoidia bacterium]
MATNGSGSVRAVVITGASTGIGEACALRLDKDGWRVFAGVRKEADGLKLKQQASERLTPVMIDVTDEGSIMRAEEAVRAAVGEAGLAGLVNNAGVAVAGPLEFMKIGDLRQQLEVNTVGQIAVTQAFLPLIRKGSGRIVNIGSIAGKMATPFLGPYTASKHAIEALTDALRQELRPWKIHVAVVEPGSIATPIWEKSQQRADDLEQSLPEGAMMLYGKPFNAMREAARKFEAAGVPPDRVAKAVQHALTSGRPRTRYIVGFDATMQRIIAAVVPDRMRDRLVAWQLKLPSKP